MSGMKDSGLNLIINELAEKYDLTFATVKYLLGEALKRYYKQDKLVFIGDGFKLNEKYRNIKESSFRKIKNDLIDRCIELEKKYQDDAFTSYLEINKIVFLKIVQKLDNGVVGEGYFDKNVPIYGISKLFAKTSENFSPKLKFIPVEIIPRSKFFTKGSRVPSFIAKIMSPELFERHLKKLTIRLSKNFSMFDGDLLNDYIENYRLNGKKWVISIKLKKTLPANAAKFFIYYFAGFGYTTKFI